MSTKKIVIAGGSGFLGRALARWHGARGAEVVVLTRNPASVRHGRAVAWDGERLGPWADELEDALALVNLSGRSVDCRYHAANRRLILDSRIESTRVLGEAVQRCSRPPAAWLNSSTATIYRHTYGPAWGEDGETGATAEARDAFSIEVARAWESAFEEAPAPPGARKIVLRAAMVLGAEPGGVYHVLRRLARLGLGGKMGSGRQYMSWIHAEDFCRAIDWLIRSPGASGVYNLAAPGPLPNAALMEALRRSLGVPFGLPAAAWMLEIGAMFLRTETELILKSRRVIPARLLREGFAFTCPEVGDALENLRNAR